MNVLRKSVLTVLAVGMLSTAAYAADSVTVTQSNGSYRITLTGNVGNSWTYQVQKISGQDLSHWDLALGSCLGNVTGITGGGTKNPAGDPSRANPTAGADTSVKGSPMIKWDTSGGTFTVTMDQAYEKKDVPVLTKSATTYGTGLVSGPDCSKPVVAAQPDPEPEVTPEPEENAGLEDEGDANVENEEGAGPETGTNEPEVVPPTEEEEPLFVGNATQNYNIWQCMTCSSPWYAKVPTDAPLFEGVEISQSVNELLEE